MEGHLNKLQFKIDGPALKEGVPIHLAVSALDNFQSIIDKTYLVATDSRKISPKEREKYFLKATEFKEGSLLTVFEIALIGVQLGLPLVSDLGPQNLWEYTKETFGFLKLVCGAVQSGEKPVYQFGNDGNVTVQTGDQEYHYHAQVIQIGQLSLANYQELAHLLDPKKLSEISAGKHNDTNPDLFLGANDKKIFDVPTRIEKETVELKCEIFDFNKFKNNGKLSVSIMGQEIPPGEYNFAIFGNQDNVDYIYSMLKPEVVLHCLIEMLSNPFGEDNVHKLHITGVGS
jgi:hypothetical protein